MGIEEFDSKLKHILSEWETPMQKDKKVIWNSIHKEISVNTKQLISRTQLYWVAASLVFVFLSFAAIYTSEVTINTTNQTLAIKLPDGSTVEVNSQSKISYNTLTWYANRSVSLTGEAFFNVTKGATFSVKTSNGTIKVLGTSFNILSRKNSFLVDCYSGKVQVANANSNILITKGEKVAQSSNSGLKKELFNATTPLWMTNNHPYTKVNLETVINDIEKEFTVSILLNEDLEKLIFSGEWNNSMPLEDVLKIVCMPFNLKAVTVSKKEIRIQAMQ